MQSSGMRIKDRTGMARIVLGVIMIAVTLGSPLQGAPKVSKKVRRKLAVLKKDGYPTSLAEMQRRFYPDFPDVPNAATKYLDAFGEIIDVKSNSLPIMGSAPLPAPGEPMLPSMLAEVEAYVFINGDALRTMHDAAGIHYCRFPLDLTEGIVLQLPHLSRMRNAARLLSLEAIANVEKVLPEDSFRSLMAAFALNRSSSQEPVLISHLVNIACQAIALRGLERALWRVPFSDEQLVALSEAIEEAASSDGFLRAMQGELCMGLDIFLNRREMLMEVEYEGKVGGLRKLFYKYVPGVWDKEILRYTNIMHKTVKAAGLPFKARIEEMAKLSAECEALPKHSLVRLLYPGLGRCASLDAAAFARLRCALVAIAVERHIRAEGRPPGKLADLVPKYIKAVPADPFDGKPLRYIVCRECYIVYSIGQDGDDDGGVEFGRRREDSDIVLLRVF